jgi:glycosyltransferase involved in cell wall biosynthesis
VGLGVPAGKIHVVARGVDTSRFAPGDQCAARRRLNIPCDVTAIVWVGRMVPVKGLDVLVEACDRLRAGEPRFHVYLVGDGYLRESLQADVAARGMADCVTFVGNVAHADLGDWYRAADFTVLPSRSEGIPNVLRESLACGTPFVASRVGGISEIAEEGSCTLVPPGDAAALAEALREAALRRPTPGGPGGVRVRQGGWAESAESLAGVLRPLVTAYESGRHGGHRTPPRVAAAPDSV